MKEAFIRFNNRTHKYETSTDGINYNDFSPYVSKERLIQYVNYHEAKDFVASVKWFTRLSY